MALGLAYWIIMLLWLILGLWHWWPNYTALGFNLVLFILLLLLGWKVFGPPLHP